ncbi:ras guanine nucleotide exchange factor i-related [Anaeramoeba flamelloides]|uniref:Ras guanine nucleotide exchange factor i-related n=1 Tax=Anaeramoeba flamelloides TaxID=1746091 RepID=A0ABQ8X089_9EUKA|nr:ras guanine nucleotide exchange factor i-related [Anaeramoeba flamelloides]
MDAVKFLESLSCKNLVQPPYQHLISKKKKPKQKDKKTKNQLLAERKKKLILINRKRERNRKIHHNSDFDKLNENKTQFVEPLTPRQGGEKLITENKDFSKFYQTKGSKRPLIKEPNVDRSNWKEQILNKHKKIKYLREQIYPTNRCESFVRIYQPCLNKNTKQLTNETILQLIMHHMTALGHHKAVESIEKESNINYSKKFLQDSRLHTLLRNSLKQSEKIWDMSFKKLPTIYQLDNKIHNIKSDRIHKSNIVEHLINVGLVHNEYNEDKVEKYANIWEEPNGKDYIKYSEKDGKTIKAATLNKLVESLTNESGVDSKFLHTFLLTYLSFTTSEMFLTKLIQRFHVPRSKDKTIDQYKIQKRKVIIRVINVIKIWIDKYLTNPDQKIIQKLQTFFTTDVAEEMPPIAEQLVTKIKKYTCKSNEIKIIKYNEKLPDPIVPKNIFSPQLSLFDVAEEEIARQITLYDYNIYSKIGITELLNLSWSKAKYKHRSPNVLTFIQQFNNLSCWIATEILKFYRVRKRTNCVTYFINVAQHLRNLNNFNSLITIFSGLNCSSIHRLKYTFQECSTRIIELKNKFEIEMASDQSYKQYRKLLHNANPPCVPYLGVYLTDLTFIEDGNPDKIEKLINFSKRRLVYAVIEEIQRYQSQPYSFQSIHQIQSLLGKLDFDTESNLYKKSLLYEPRKAKREDIK